MREDMIRAYKIMNVTEKAEQEPLSFLSHNTRDNEAFKEIKRWQIQTW